MKKTFPAFGLVVLFSVLFIRCEKDEPVPEPTASFTISKTMADVGEVITFTNTSENATGYFWDFGDGNTSNENNPTHAYTSDGMFTIVLLATTKELEATSSESITVIYPVPVASFTIVKPSIAIDEMITFTNTSENGTIFSWDFGDGNTSNEENPTHSYAAIGSYSIALTVNGAGGESIEIRPDYIHVFNVVDVDGNGYYSVIIGNQEWLAENLKVTHYNDGTEIPNVTDITEWLFLTTGAYCWYNNNENYKETYGALYNWYTVDTKKLCPDGWHCPTDAEWTILTNYLGGEIGAGGLLKEEGTEHWIEPNFRATNETGFTALPGGYRKGIGSFKEIGQIGQWWVPTNPGADYTWTRKMRYLDDEVQRSRAGNSALTPEYNWGFSVRCIKD